MIFKDRVKRIYERKKMVWISGVGRDAVMQEVSEGWYVAFDHGGAFRHGATEPTDFKVGDQVVIEVKKL